MKKGGNKFLEHFKTWEPFYNFIGHILVFVALSFTAIGLYTSRQALRDSSISVDLTKEALNLQREEFQLRNRPIVIIRNFKFLSSDTKSEEGVLYKNSVAFELTNSSEIPANDMLIKGTAYLNDKEVQSTILGAKSLIEDIGVTSLPKDHVTSGEIFLETPVFQKALSLENHFRVLVEATYSGMLGESKEAYKTVVEMKYDPVKKQFGMIKSIYK